MNISLEGMSQEEISKLALTAKGLAADPKTREGFQRLIKEQNPDLVIPEIDIPARFQAQLEAERAARKEIEDRLNKDALERRILADRQVIMSKGIPESEIPAVEKLMTERGIVNHETAAEFHLAQKKMAEPTPPASNSGFAAFEMPKFDKGNGLNPRQVAKNTALQLWGDFKSGKAVA